MSEPVAKPMIDANALRENGKRALLDTLETCAIELGLDQPLWIERLKTCAGQTHDEFARFESRQGFESVVGLTASSISLVHEDELSFSLELSNLVRKLREACMPELSVLHRRYLVLLGLDDMPLEQCPVGPDAVARALRALIEAVGPDAGQRQKLLERSLAVLASRLRALYVELNRILKEAGVEPRPMSVAGSAGRGQHGVAPGHAPAAGQPFQTHEAGALVALQARLRQRRPNGAGEAAALDPELAAAIRERVLIWLAQRQAAGDAGAMRLAGTELAPLLPASTAVAVEAVEQVFAAIAGFEDIAPVGRELLAGLKIPFLRLALVDDALLADPGHPARVLLDSVASIAATVVQADASEPTVVQLHDIVQGLQRSEASGAEAFARAQTVLDHLESDLQRRYKALARESIDGAERAERRETAMVKASGIVDELIGEHTPPPIRDFLERWWLQLLARTIYSHGVTHDASRSAIELARSLVMASGVGPESAASLTQTGGRAALVAGLKRGLGFLGLEAEASSSVLAPVVSVLEQLRSGQIPGASRNEFTVVPTLTEISGARTLRLLHHAGHAVISGGTPAAASAVVGDWLSLDMPEGNRFVGGVAWVGPDKRVLLLVDPARAATLAVSRRAIVDLGNQGKCQLIDRSSITERAAARALHKPLE